MLKANMKALYRLQGDKTDTQFAKELGISRTQYWRIKCGSSVGGIFIEKFKKKYPDQNTDEYFFTK